MFNATGGSSSLQNPARFPMEFFRDVPAGGDTIEAGHLSEELRGTCFHAFRTGKAAGLHLCRPRTGLYLRRKIKKYELEG